jgi:hypothetical protein
MTTPRRFLIASALPTVFLAASLAAGCAETNKPAATADAASSSGQATAPVVDDRRLLRFFGLMDQDQNGSVSRPEFETGKGMVFMAMDADENQMLTQNEMRLTPEAFGALAGSDGSIDGAEFQNSNIGRFEDIDADGNLELTYEELRAYVAEYE